MEISILQINEIKNSLLHNFNLSINFVKSLNILRITLLLFILIPFSFLIAKLNFENSSYLNIKQLVIFWFIPMFLIGMLSTMKDTVISKYLCIFILFLFLSYFYVNSLKIISFSLYLFLILSFKDILNNYYFISIKKLNNNE